MRFRVLVQFLCAFSALSCKSLDGLSGEEPPEDAGTDADAALEAEVPACVPSTDMGTLCVTVQHDTSTPSPGYGAFAGSGSVKADGVGFIQVFLFDKDPLDVTNGHVLPKVTLRYPSAAGTTTSIDSLPKEIVGTAFPGTYWVYALFEDNEVDSRGTGLLTALPGDFVTPQAIDTADLYPKVELTANQVLTLEITVRPLRKLTVNATAAPSLLQAAQSNATIHGDGPASFFLYDGNLATGAPTIVDFGQVKCLDLELSNPSPPAAVSVWFGVESTGDHNMYGNVYDYAVPSVTGTQPPGTLETNALQPALVFVDPTQWTASVEVPFVSVILPMSGSPTDPQHCN